MKIGNGNAKKSKIEVYRGLLIPRFALFLIVFYLSGCGEKPSLIHFSGSTMGTWYSVKYSDGDKNPGKFGPELVKAKADSVLKQVNLQMSTYMMESEISRFNQYKDTTWFPVSQDFASVVSIALNISEETLGVFDITVGPLVNIWGFGSQGDIEDIPSDHEISATMKKTGFKNLTVRLAPPALKKRIPDLYCDLSAIAKGFGVDKIAELLTNMGIENYMIEIGGEVRTSGLHDKIPWRIGISTPDEKQGIQSVVNLKDDCIATSGDYHNYFEKEGKRYSHTIDPVTGKPITHNLASVSVIFPNCTEADAYATALNVMGPTKALKFASEKKLSVFMLVKERDGFSEMKTASFNKYLTKMDKD